MELAEEERKKLEPELCNLKLDSADLLKQVAELELKGSKKILFDPKVLSTFDSLLLDVHTILQPKAINYEQRRFLVQVFSKMAREIFGNKNDFPLVEAFGSFTMDLFTSTSDLDLSINFSNDMIQFPRDMKISVLKKLAKVLFARQRRGSVTRVRPIMKARVPVLKVVDCETKIECDISVENKDGISRSMFYSAVASIDERFRILSFLMKAWARAHDVNSSKDGTMNSLSIISLVAFHLQTRNPPILPPFCVLLKDGTDMSSIRRNITEFKQYTEENQESVGELFLALLIKLSSVEHLWQHGLCASIYEGSWIYKRWKSGIGNISVEDFSDRSENFARSVGRAEMPRICESIQGSLSNLSSFAVAEMKASELKAILFGPIEPKSSTDEQLCNKVKLDKKVNPSDGSPAAVNSIACITTFNRKVKKRKADHPPKGSHDSSTTVAPTTSKRPKLEHKGKPSDDSPAPGIPKASTTASNRSDAMIHEREVDHPPKLNSSRVLPTTVAPTTTKRPVLEKRWKVVKHYRAETSNALPNHAAILRSQVPHAHNPSLTFLPLQPALGPYPYRVQHPDAYVQSGRTSHGLARPIFTPPQPALRPYYQLQHPDAYIQPGYISLDQRRPFVSPPYGLNYQPMVPSQFNPYGAPNNQSNHVYTYHPGSRNHHWRNF